MSIVAFVVNVLIGIGVVCFGIGIAFSIRSLLRLRSWTPVQAEIVESSVEAFFDSNARRLFRGVYLLRYKASRDIREALVRSEYSDAARNVIAAKVASHPAGSRLGVYYLTHAPGQVSTNLATGLRAHLPSIAMFLFGAAAGILAWMVLFLSQPVEW